MYPDNGLICDLWSELKMLEHNSSITTVAPTANITCIYSQHQHSSGPLCDLWCQIQSYKGGKQCVSCPEELKADPEGTLLCQLWEELTEHQNSEDSTTVATPTHTSCIYESTPASSEKLCDLWCQVQAFHGKACCPSEYIADQQEELLCQLWNELE